MKLPLHEADIYKTAAMTPAVSRLAARFLESGFPLASPGAA
jgi:hypothetical protein